MLALRRLAGPARVPAFRLLLAAQLASTAGSVAGQLALAVLVLSRTGSAMASAVAFVSGLLPFLGPGQWVAARLSHWPARRLLVGSDLLRAAVWATMLVPHLPAWSLVALAALSGLVTPAFDATVKGVLPELLGGELFADAIVGLQMAMQLCLVLGYSAGGAVVAFAGAPAVLGANAVSFAVSAMLLSRLTRLGTATRGRVSVRDAVRAVRGAPPLRRLTVAAAVLAGAAMGAEALAPAFAKAHHAGAAAAGLLVMCVPVGTLLAAPFAPRSGTPGEIVTAAARRTGAAALLGAALLFVPLPLTAVGFAAVGAVFTIVVPIGVLAGTELPADTRASAIAVLQGVLVAGQAGGAAAGAAVAGAVGVRPALQLLLAGAAVLVVATLGRRTRPPATAGRAAD